MKYVSNNEREFLEKGMSFICSVAQLAIFKKALLDYKITPDVKHKIENSKQQSKAF